MGIADKPYAPVAPWRQALWAVRNSAGPGIVILLLMALVVWGYYAAIAPIQQLFGFLADGRATYGLGFVFVAAGLAGGVFAELLRVLFLQKGRWHRRNFAEMTFRFILLGFLTAVSAKFYELQAYLLGHRNDIGIVVAKTLIDQFVYSMLFTTPLQACAMDWWKSDLAPTRWRHWFKWYFLRESIAPVFVTNLFFWFPACLLMYYLPLELQWAFGWLAGALWGVILTVLTLEQQGGAALQCSHPEDRSDVDPDIARPLGHYGLPLSSHETDHEQSASRKPAFFKSWRIRPVRVKKVTAEEALKIFSRDHREFETYRILRRAVAGALTSTELHVTEHVKLPPTVRELPKNVVFLKGLDATQSGLKEFHGKVVGPADFSGSGIQKFGKTASFSGHLDASNTENLKEFMGVVKGDASFAGSSIHTIHRKASFGGNVNTRNTPNIRGQDVLSRRGAMSRKSFADTVAEDRISRGGVTREPLSQQVVEPENPLQTKLPDKTQQKMR
jgi:hypothetical protein